VNVGANSKVRLPCSHYVRCVTLSFPDALRHVRGQLFYERHSMNSTLRAAALSIVVAVSGSMAAAQDFDKGMSAYRAGDYATALNKWRPLAEQGDADAQMGIGSIYYQGVGVLQDYEEAIKYYRLAAEQGLAEAQSRLAAVHYLGEAVPQNYTETMKWIRRAAEQG
jgi:TPR repeat protein